ncbi:hypothetical protein ACFV19_33060 [Streptomyces griseoluteus]|uniref:hypothetical protein n=1 Tax=Streptomyces griseoluteus TaxID=29306 RepID=UPI0036B508FA
MEMKLQWSELLSIDGALPVGEPGEEVVECAGHLDTDEFGAEAPVGAVSEVQVLMGVGSAEVEAVGFEAVNAGTAASARRSPGAAAVVRSSSSRTALLVKPSIT